MVDNPTDQPNRVTVLFSIRNIPLRDKTTTATNRRKTMTDDAPMLMFYGAVLVFEEENVMNVVINGRK